MANNKNTELVDFVDNVCDKSHLRVESDLGDGYFRLRATEAQRRQAQQDIRCSEDIVIETLRNSRDAGAKNIFLATNTESDFRNIIIIDDGSGVPKNHHKTIFEPYVTSKLDTMTKDIWGIHGRGMALYSISVNCEDSHVVKSDNGLGCSIYVKTNTKKLGEKKDQSSFPSFHINDDQELLIRGPKNIIRTCCEFAIENRGKINLYIGSPVEIACTLYNLKQNDNFKSIFKSPDDNTKLLDLLSYAADVHDFKTYAKDLGIELSKRTARRIMDGDIKPLPNILEKITQQGITKKDNTSTSTTNNTHATNAFDIFSIKKIYKASPKNKSIKMSDEDKETLKNSLCNSFSKIADKYYLNKEIEPKINIKNSKITLSFDVSETD